MINKKLIFKPISEKWTQVNPNAGESAAAMADTLQDLGIITITIHNNKYE